MLPSPMILIISHLKSTFEVKLQFEVTLINDLHIITVTTLQKVTLLLYCSWRYNCKMYNCMNKHVEEISLY